jgi:hypothetical protein
LSTARAGELIRAAMPRPMEATMAIEATRRAAFFIGESSF